ncbi:hypothetical protein K8R62_03550, partial [bacterium]|nr:hypothetical protein [bacterium]
KWFDNFTKENVLPIILERVSKNSEREIGYIYSFIGADKKFVPNFHDKHLNRTHGLRFPKVQKAGRSIYRKMKSMPMLSKFLFINNIKIFVNKTNRKQAEKPKIPEDLKNDFKKYFLEDIKILEKLLNRDLSIWK